MNELEHNLRILVENDLARKLLLLDESTLKDKKEIAKEFIGSFIGSLPIQYRTLKDCNKIIADVLRNRGVNSIWIGQNLMTSEEERDEER